jgi:hypothetical protein
MDAIQIPAVGSTCRIRPARSALATALMLVLAGVASPVHAGEATPWQRLKSDPRVFGAASMTSQERWALAREFGLESFLPAPSGTEIPVSNCNDAGAGSLRDAIAVAADGDTVDARGLTCGTISLTTGAIAVGLDNLLIIGPGPGLLNVKSGAKYGRVFKHTGTGSLMFAGMTISGGTISPAATENGTQGGCIYSSGTVNLGNAFAPDDASQGVVVSQCTAISTAANVPARGGGVFARLGLSLTNSIVTGCNVIAQDQATTAQGGGVALAGAGGPFSMKYSEIRDNSASGMHGIGGGADAAFAATVSVSHSTIAGNDASGRAGGAYLGTNTGEAVVIENSTISGNTSAAGEGGLVVNVLAGATPGTIGIWSSTISANRSDGIGGADGLFAAGPLQLQSTIISGNGDANALDLHLTGVATGADNLIGVTFGTPPPNGLIISSDPRLAPLVNGGGRTRTHAPQANSQAIDSGNNAGGFAADQRGDGYARVLGARADIGACERDGDVIFRNGFD